MTLPASPAVMDALAQVYPDSDALALQTPIIDMHVHTFNARYLPIQGIALGKRDKFLATQFVSDSVAWMVAEVITDRTKMADVPGQKSLGRMSFLSVANELSSMNADPSAELDPAVIGAMKLTADDAEIGVSGDAQELPSALGQLSTKWRTAPSGGRGPQTMSDTELRALESAFGGTFQTNFLRLLVSSDGEMESFYRRTYYHPAGLEQVQLLVSHMMDLGPVYDQQPSEGRFLDFVSEQIPRYAYFQQQPDSRMVYFVAFNPYRDFRPGNGPGSLQIVKDAIEKNGALGVKVYPPSGYRAAGNRIPSRPRALNPSAGRQWAARYTKADDTPVTDSELDALVRELLEYCENHHIPVFAHCHTGEFEARNGYGRMMAHPRWWKQYLAERSQRLGYKSKLRLCFGHAGGDAFWFGSGLEEDFEWGQTVAELCQEYENVYAEIGVLDSGTQSLDRRAYFAGHLVDLYSRYPLLPKKLMYGTDWNMDTAVKAGRDYLKAYQTVFCYEPLRVHYADFFWLNAARFLDLDRHRAGSGKPSNLPQVVRKRLESLMQQAVP